jgi:hypothetical protein
MSNWRGFVSRLMAMGAMIQIGNTDGTLVAARLPRVAETPKPRPAGMATEFQRNIKPPKKGKGTRKQRKEAQRRLNRMTVSENCFFRWQMTRAFMVRMDGSIVIRYGSKAHRRALAKLTQ